MATHEGRALLTEHYTHYAEIARSIDAAVLLDAPTWRANPDWAATLGHDRAALADLIAESVSVVTDVRTGWTGSEPFLVGGAVGPRGDGYRIDSTMHADEAADYHSFQVAAMAATGIDVVDALTMGYVDEAVGIDDMVELDSGDPDDLAARYVGLRSSLPNLHVVGGCCGTDHRHVAAIAAAWQQSVPN